MALEQIPESNTDTPVAPRSRENNFGFLRLLFAGLVLYGHSRALLLGEANQGTTARLLEYYSVAAFFVISGYLVTQSWNQMPKLSVFALKRILRIYPAFLASVLFCALLIGPNVAVQPDTYWSDLFHLTPRGMIYSFFLRWPSLPLGFARLPVAGVMNGSSWTIPYEFTCYVGVAILGLVGAINRKWVIGALFLIAVTLSYFAELHIIPLSDQFSPVFLKLSDWPHLAMYYLAGMTIYVFRDAIQYRAWASILLGLFVAFYPRVYALVPAGHLPVLIYRGTIVLLTAAFVLAVSYLIFAVAFARIPRLSKIGSRNDISYGLYIYAWPIQQTIVLLYLSTISPIILFISSIIITSIVSYASWRWIESPALRLKPRTSRSPS